MTTFGRSASDVLYEKPEPVATTAGGRKHAGLRTRSLRKYPNLYLRAGRHFSFDKQVYSHLLVAQTEKLYVIGEKLLEGDRCENVLMFVSG
mmetsp:Transcript_42040/g.65728  ORF Transcript_42040/g.65728 Transcript_42040/m.65728 type:complete len:91 (-) Transcript_42040:359-631(-)